jgi:hypothetical protein
MTLDVFWWCLAVTATCCLGIGWVVGWSGGR